MAAEADSQRGRHKWVGHGMSNRLIYGGTVLGCTYLPKPILYGISLVGNEIALAMMHGTLAAVTENHRLAFGLDEPAARRLARRTFHAYGRTTVDLFRTRGGGFERLPKVTTHDRDDAILRRTVHPDRGALIVTGHVGNWELGGISLAAHDFRVAVVGQAELDPEVHALRLATRERFRVETIDIGTSMATALRVRQAVEGGRIVAMVADRAYPEDHVLVPFLGRDVPFLASPARLARFCACPLVPCYFLRSADGTYRSYFADPIEPDPQLSVEDDVRRTMIEVAKVVERAIREEPQQWFNFYPYWTTPLVGREERASSPEALGRST